MANRYWVGTGNWDTTNTANWSASSGGAGGASVPTSADAVFFDVNSGNCTLGNDVPFLSFNSTGYTGTITCSFYGFQPYGNITLNSGITLSGTNKGGTLSFRASSTVITAGKTLWPINVIGSSPTIVFSDAVTSAGAVAFFNSCTVNFNSTLSCTALTIGSASASVTFSNLVTCSSTVTHSAGTINLNGNLTCTAFTASGAGVKTFNANSAIITLTAAGTVWNYAGSNLTFNRGASKIVLSNTTASARTFAGGGLTYYDLEIGGVTGISTLTLTGSNTFNTVSSVKTVAHTIRLTAGTTTTVTNWDVNGTSGNQVTLNSATAGSQATLAKAGGGTVSVNYTTVQDIIGSPTSTWSALTSNGCVDGGNNTGWTFSGGTVYNVALSEVGTVADSQTVVFTVTPVISESVSVVDSQNSSLNLTLAVSESGSATDSITASGSISITVDVSEDIVGTDAQTVDLITLSTLTETVTVGDSYSAAGSTYNTQVSEALTVQDVVSSILVIVSILSESLSVTETQATALDVIANITESITAGGTQESVLSLVAELVEIVTTNDLYDAGGSTYNVALTEAGDAQLSLLVGGIFNVAVLEALNASDSVAGRLLWELINDIQNANWNTVVNTQNPNWVSIGDAQNPNWTPINTFGTS